MEITLTRRGGSYLSGLVTIEAYNKRRNYHITFSYDYNAINFMIWK